MLPDPPPKKPFFCVPCVQFKLRTISPNVSPVFLRLTLGLDFSSVIFFRLTGAEGGGAGVGEGAGAGAGVGAGAEVGAGAGESATSPPKWAIRQIGRAHV